jgi:hypothetical protein
MCQIFPLLAKHLPFSIRSPPQSQTQKSETCLFSPRAFLENFGAGNEYKLKCVNGNSW